VVEVAIVDIFMALIHVKEIIDMSSELGLRYVELSL
jgi:hypothetical protein